MVLLRKSDVVIMVGGDKHCQALETFRGKFVADGASDMISKGKLPIIEA